MREPSIYFSPTFYPQIWQDFSRSFKSKGAKSDYFMLCCDICDFAGKDFLALTDDDAQAYFDLLLSRQMNGKLSLDTINVKFYRLHSLSKYNSLNQEKYKIT